MREHKHQNLQVPNMSRSKIQSTEATCFARTQSNVHFCSQNGHGRDGLEPLLGLALHDLSEQIAAYLHAFHAPQITGGRRILFLHYFGVPQALELHTMPREALSNTQTAMALKLCESTTSTRGSPICANFATRCQNELHAGQTAVSNRDRCKAHNSTRCAS